jgi:uncharacterized membrane protein (GlpM family)
VTLSTGSTSVRKYVTDNVVIISSSFALIGFLLSSYNAMISNGTTNVVIQFLCFSIVYSVILGNLLLLNEVGYQNASLGLCLVWLFANIAIVLFPIYFSPLWSIYNHSSTPAQVLIALAVPINVLSGFGFEKLVRYVMRKIQ